MRRRNRERLTITIAGAHRGAEYLLDPLAAWQRESAQFALVRIVDMRADRVEGGEEQAQAHGFLTEGLPARLEDFLGAGLFRDKVMILTLDQAESLAKALRLLDGDHVILVYFLLRLPNNLLLGLAMLFTPEETLERERAARFFELLAPLTLRTGSEAIIGEGGLPEHLLAEGLLRGFLGKHLKDNLGRVLAGLPPVVAPMLVTEDGVTGSQLIIVDNTGADGASTIRPIRLQPGSAIVVAELGESSIRFVRVRLRGQGARGLSQELLRQERSSSALRPSEDFFGELAEYREITTATLMRPLAMTD